MISRIARYGFGHNPEETFWILGSVVFKLLPVSMALDNAASKYTCYIYEIVMGGFMRAYIMNECVRMRKTYYCRKNIYIYIYIYILY